MKLTIAKLPNPIIKISKPNLYDLIQILSKIIPATKRTNYQFYQQQLQLQKKKMRKISNTNYQVPLLLETPKTNSYSLSTQESPRQCNYPSSSHKEKSQLCKKFVQNGYCPYQKKCKFAHGLQELKKNHQANSKYKTKICGAFLQEGFCQYGNRCNFIHPTSKTSTFIRNIDLQFANIKMESRKQSKLLKLLED